MFIYKSTKKNFINDTMNPHSSGFPIADLIKEEFEKRVGKVNIAEYHSWQNSLKQMAMVINTDRISDDASVCIEYRLPFQNCRIDFLIAGRDSEGNENVVIVELKQWSEVAPLKDEDLVSTLINGSMRNVPHPSYQAWSYAITLREYNECIQKDGILLYPCSYMHNYIPYDEDPIINSKIYKEIEKAPVFTCKEDSKLQDYIVSKVTYPDDSDMMFRIDYGKLKPSKSLQDVIARMLDRNNDQDEFVLIDSQKSIFGFIMAAIHKMKHEDDGKSVFIISGGPGTGKSVLAINLLAASIKDEKVSAYVTKNSAPRNVYKTKLSRGDFKKAYIESLFKSSGGFVGCDSNAYDVLIVDEAHRLNEKSDFFGRGENQIKEIINASKISIFFIDENQIVTAKDIGSIREIRRFAKMFNAKVYKSALESQFRCNGSDGYLSFLDDVLDIAHTDYTFNPSDYDIVVCDDPKAMFEDIKEKNEIDNKARMLAGYCWNWISKNDRNAGPDIKMDDQNFSAYWNFNNTSTWAIDSDTIDQVGCIHTSQGLEFSYVGVIIGDDLRYENGRVITDRTKRAKTDSSLHGLKSSNPDDAKKIDKIIRDTYKTLLSRAMKGCYVYCTDKALAEHIKDKLSENKKLYDEYETLIETVSVADPET